MAQNRLARSQATAHIDSRTPAFKLICQRRFQRLLNGQDALLNVAWDWHRLAAPPGFPKPPCSYCYTANMLSAPVQLQPE